MPLWTFLGRNVNSSNLFLWENTLFLTLRFPRNNCGSRGGMPLLCSHAIHPPSHQILKGLFLTSLTLLFSQNHYLIWFRSSEYYLREKTNKQTNGTRDFWQGGHREVNCRNAQQILRAKKVLPSYIHSAKMIIK